MEQLAGMFPRSSESSDHQWKQLEKCVIIKLGELYLAPDVIVTSYFIIKITARSFPDDHLLSEQDTLSVIILGNKYNRQQHY